MLYIVSTPIGNLKDMTLRALEVLKSVDLIASEDTRHTGLLLKHFGITTPQTSYFEHNTLKKSAYLLGLLKEGRSIALVTDAGTPGISDPGYRLIRLAREEGIEMTVVPGACALVAALCLSGLPSDRFVFAGFLPPKPAARCKHLEKYKNESRTVIFYESPHRLLRMLRDIADVLDDPLTVCAREMTKKFEEVKRGTAREMYDHFSRHAPKGEFVVLINNKENRE